MGAQARAAMASWVHVANSSGAVPAAAVAALLRGGHCEAPLLRTSLRTTLEEAHFGWEPHLPAPWEGEVERLAVHWDRCARRGGRLWEVWSDAHAAGPQTLCAHRDCGQREVEEKLWLVLSWRQQWAVAPGRALELAHWRQLNLDFVLAGFEKCGTSSLSHNLARHPEVDFVPEVDRNPHINTDDQEAQDGNFFWFNGNRMLPAAQLVVAFNRGDCCKGGAMPNLSEAQVSDSSTPSSSSTSSRRAKLLSHVSVDDFREATRQRGERNPVYAANRFIMKAISLVPSAKVVLIACDPVGWLHSAYHDTNNWYAGDPDDPPRPPLSEFAKAEMVPAPRPTSLSGDGWYNLSRRRALFSLLVKGLAALFGSQSEARLHLMHRDAVDERLAHGGLQGVRGAYGRLATFLNLRPFPPDFAFERRNIAKKLAQEDTAAQPLRASLCGAEESSALARLKWYYRREYRDLPLVLERFGGHGSVPPRLAANRTYCDP